MSAEFCINSWADLPPAIVAAEQAGAIGLAHLLRALNAGRIAFLPVLPETSATKFKQFARLTTQKPAVVLISDDDYMDRGPAGFRVGEQAIRWAASIIVHAAGAEVGQYEAAIVGAQFVKRVLLIECGTVTAPAWVDLSRRLPKPAPITLIWPKEGLHPVMPAGTVLQ